MVLFIVGVVVVPPMFGVRRTVVVASRTVGFSLCSPLYCTRVTRQSVFSHHRWSHSLSAGAPGQVMPFVLADIGEGIAEVEIMQVCVF
jgi:hypothetical protein